MAMTNAGSGLNVGLHSHQIDDSKKFTGTTSCLVNQKRDVRGDSGTISKPVLKNDNFKFMYRAKVRLTQVMDRNHMSTAKEQICQFHNQHKQVLDILKIEYRGGIEQLDSKSAVIGITLRHLIL